MRKNGGLRLGGGNTQGPELFEAESTEREVVLGGRDAAADDCLGGTHRTRLAEVREPAGRAEERAIAALRGRGSRVPTGLVRVLQCAKCGRTWVSPEVE